MQLSNAPGKLLLPFANAGAKNTIPTASQIGITAGAASLTDGFPPLTRTPIAAGGVPPSGLDMNGILYALSAALRWANAGGGYVYDGTFAADSNVGGYPKGARVLRSDGLGYWFNTTDNNTTNPEGAGAVAAGWVPDFTNGAAAVTMTNANVTLTALQYGKPIIVISGLLTANLNLIFPNIVDNWTVVNKTTGAKTITCKTAAGLGVVAPQSSAVSIYGDATDIVALSYASTSFANQTGSVVGTVRNAAMSVTAASATAGFTADEVVVETSLGGSPLRLASFNKTVNLATTGAGGMDTGTAPVSGYVALYAIYNPTTLTAALLAANATAAAAPNIYGGANMPAGYTYSALVSVWPTDGSSRFVIGCQSDRQISIAQTQVLLTTTQQLSPTLLSIATAVPKNAKTASGYMVLVASSSVASGLFSVASSATIGQQLFSPYLGQIFTSYTCPFCDLQLLTPQTLYYTESVSAGGAQAALFINGYTF